MPGRTFTSATGYRYGFGGQEKDDEISGNGNAYTADYWEYDPRLGRRWNTDPISYPGQSPYATFNNNPILISDPEGLEGEKKGDTFVGDDGKTYSTSVDATEIVMDKSAQSTKAATPVDKIAATINTPTPSVGAEKYNGQKVADFTLSKTGKYLRGSGAAQTRPIDMSPTQGETRFDCSGWVGYCLNQSYPNLYTALQIGPTSNIEAYGRLHGGVRTSSPLVGDLALWDGHVEIVTAVNGDAFQTSGSTGSASKNTPVPSKKNFTSTSDPQLKQYGANAPKGVFKGFWTPQVPQPKLKVSKIKG